MDDEQQKLLQTVFNKAWKGLRRQGWRKSMTPDSTCADVPMCAYRGADGMRCAIGWAIPNARYKREFEGKSPMDDDVCAAVTNGAKYSVVFARALHELQSCHDDARRGIKNSGMRQRMVRFAVSYNLEIPE